MFRIEITILYVCHGDFHIEIDLYFSSSSLLERKSEGEGGGEEREREGGRQREKKRERQREKKRGRVLLFLTHTGPRPSDYYQAKKGTKGEGRGGTWKERESLWNTQTKRKTTEDKREKMTQQRRKEKVGQ